jgi:small GTP-binding protein
MVDRSFSDVHLPTVGTNFHEITVPSSNGDVVFQVFDTAGEERFRSLAPLFCQNASVVLIVFDLSVRSSFQDDLIDYFVTCAGRASDGALFYLVGNKCDLVDHRCISAQSAEQMVWRIYAQYLSIGEGPMSSEFVAPGRKAKTIATLINKVKNNI